MQPAARIPMLHDMSTAESVFSELRPPLTRADAILEADRCLECGGPYAEAPCTVACPADVDVAGFVAALAADDPARAAQTIWAENLLGGSCARVCPVELLCQGACVLEHEGRRPVEIAALQRFATDWALEDEIDARTAAPPTGHAVAVVGAGPAGLACAGELAARGHTVTVYDERAEVGGLVRYAIAPYRLSREPLPGEHELLRRLGVRFELGTEVDASLLRTIESEHEAVFLGVGMGADADVHYPGDDLEGVWDSLDFIAALKVGTPPQIGRRVCVIGGGNTAIDAAVEAKKLGGDVVALLYRRTEEEMPAYPHEIELARREGVRIELLVNPIAFIGRDHVIGIECSRMRLGERDASGRRRPEPVPGTDFVIPCDTVVKAIGQRPRVAFLGLVEGLELEAGRIVVDPDTGRTGNPRFYAGGDATSGGATVVQAVRDAKRAARAIDAVLAGAA
jgi:dihydropyrimidine dehydrogenase (NAD+) subunit PreT